MKVLAAAIVSKITGTAFNTNIGGRLYLAEAPPNSATFPYCVFDIVSGTTDWDFNNVTEMEEITVSFSIFSNDTMSAVETLDLYENLKSVFDNCSLTVVGWTHVYMWRTHNSLLRDPESSIWQQIVDYDILLTK